MEFKIVNGLNLFFSQETDKVEKIPMHTSWEEPRS